MSEVLRGLLSFIAPVAAFVAFLAAVDSSTASSPPPTTGYPSVVIRSFENVCNGVEGSTSAYCQCVVKKLVHRVPYTDFVKAQSQILEGRGSQTVRMVLAPCKSKRGTASGHPSSGRGSFSRLRH
jgi:hypothetical protein